MYVDQVGQRQMSVAAYHQDQYLHRKLRARDRALLSEVEARVWVEQRCRERDGSRAQDLLC